MSSAKSSFSITSVCTLIKFETFFVEKLPLKAIPTPYFLEVLYWCLPFIRMTTQFIWKEKKMKLTKNEKIGLITMFDRQYFVIKRERM